LNTQMKVTSTGLGSLPVVLEYLRYSLKILGFVLDGGYYWNV